MRAIAKSLVDLIRFFLSFINSNFFQSKIKGKVTRLFKRRGIELNGSQRWDIQVKNEDFYTRLSLYTVLGFAESYMDGWWTVGDLEEMFYKSFTIKWREERLLQKVTRYLLCSFYNLHTKTESMKVAHQHYNLGNDLFESFLDPTMNYSCGYWRKAKNLNEAQLNKMDLIARKLKLEPGMKVLDIGCGWGGLSKYLAENYHVNVVGITISEEQVKFAKNVCKGLPVEIRAQDYRDLNGEKFDRIVSVGMFEHVGENKYREYLTIANKCLTDDGIFLLHTIGANLKNFPRTDEFSDKYIFPNGEIPYYKHITDYSEGLFIIEDWHNFGADYSKTLKAWYANFVQNWPNIKEKYGERFYRMWTLYLQSASALFRSRRYQLYQVVFSKHGLIGGYESVR